MIKQYVFDNKKLKELREKKGWTLAKVAEELKNKFGISKTRQTINTWELGHIPSASHAKNLAELYDVPLDSFFKKEKIK